MTLPYASPIWNEGIPYLPPTPRPPNIFKNPNISLGNKVFINPFLRPFPVGYPVIDSSIFNNLVTRPDFLNLGVKQSTSEWDEFNKNYVPDPLGQNFLEQRATDTAIDRVPTGLSFTPRDLTSVYKHGSIPYNYAPGSYNPDRPVVKYELNFDKLLRDMSSRIRPTNMKIYEEEIINEEIDKALNNFGKYYSLPVPPPEELIPEVSRNLRKKKEEFSQYPIPAGLREDKQFMNNLQFLQWLIDNNLVGEE